MRLLQFVVRLVIFAPQFASLPNALRQQQQSQRPHQRQYIPFCIPADKTVRQLRGYWAYLVTLTS